MKTIVTHAFPDWDAITSVWLLKRYLPGWHDAAVSFVPAGERVIPFKGNSEAIDEAIEKSGEDEVIHVDTGLGPLDHHHIRDLGTSAAGRVWEFVKQKNHDFRIENQGNEKIKDRMEALGRIVRVVIDIDHFREVYWANPLADYHEFSLVGVLEGLKTQRPGEDEVIVNFGMECLDALLHEFENRIWAEREIKNKAREFETKWGRGIAFETLNDTVLKLAQKMGYLIVVRKDPRKGYVRIKTLPDTLEEERGEKNAVDFTHVYEKFKELDPHATWYLHISKKMLLNGTTKNPTMVPTTLSLEQIIEVLENV